MFLIDVETSERQWTPEQAWYLIKKIGASEEGSLRYSETLLSDLFKQNGKEAIQDLEQVELISVSTANGRPYAILPGRPVYLAAFRRLAEDLVLQSRLDLAILTKLINIENNNINKYETELEVLGSLPTQPSELRPRVKWLLNKLGMSQAKVEKYEGESDTLRKILQVEY
jgi:hypothetical protein